MSRFDLRRLLRSASFYSSLRQGVGGNDCRKVLLEHLRPAVGDRLLDIGCGPADVLSVLPEVAYVGNDPSSRYVRAATERYGSRGTFHCASVADLDAKALGRFDLVVAEGVVHHLDDEEASRLFQIAASVLQPGGRLVTLDGCFVDNQSTIARALLRWDRGDHVRNLGGYESLASRWFASVEANLHDDLLRIPYTHLFLICEIPQAVELERAGG